MAADSKPIPFANNQESGYDPLAGGTVLAMNVVIDAKGTVRRRPGIVASSSVSSESFSGLTITGGVVGIHATEEGNVLAVVETDSPERGIYKVGPGGSRKYASYLPGTGRPVFAETIDMVVMAGGRELQKYVKATDTVSPLGGKPPLADVVIGNASRLLANDKDDTSIIRVSDIRGSVNGGYENWTQGVGNAAYFSAEARPDPVVTLGESTNEVWVFGTTTLQMFAPSDTPYDPASAREYGCAAKGSVVKVDGYFFWLDHKRRFVRSDGRSIDAISSVIQDDLNVISRVDDCFGYRVLTGNMDAIVWTFPTDGRTFVWQKELGWGQWSAASEGLLVNRYSAPQQWRQFPVTSHHLWGAKYENLVGTKDGLIGKLDPDVGTDWGMPIPATVETGYINRGTDLLKHCKRVQLTFRRGTRRASSEQNGVLLSWRDRPGEWDGALEVNLGATGDTHCVVDLCSLGTYRRRQWRIDFTGTDPLILLDCVEHFDVLGV